MEPSLTAALTGAALLKPSGALRTEHELLGVPAAHPPADPAPLPLPSWGFLTGGASSRAAVTLPSAWLSPTFTCSPTSSFHP